MTYKPRRRGGTGKERRSSALLFAVLIAVNLGVFAYHGDPRDLVGNEASAATLQGQMSSDIRSSNLESPKQEESDELQGAVQENAPASDASEEAEEQLEIVEPAQTAESVETAIARLAQLSSDYDPLVGARTLGPIRQVERVHLKPRQTPASALLDLGIATADVTGAVSSLQEFVDFRKVRPGARFTAGLDGVGNLVSLDLFQNVLNQTKTLNNAGTWVAERKEITVTTVPAAISGEVKSSLWNALIEAGEQAALVGKFVDVFAWEIDFYSEIRQGDVFRILVDKQYVDGELIGYGDIHAAEFVNAGQTHRGFMKKSADGVVAYYDAKGRSMRKQLLKSPLRYGHVTSRFGKRRHPVLGYTRSHNGIDYGVPTGTPVWSVGDGRVVKAGWHGGFGKLVEVRYPNGWKAQYAHLSKILVRVGQWVTQKQHIGHVGTTGMSTGPHLHYGLKHHGAYVNPLAQKFERGRALTGEELEGFLGLVPDLEARLDSIRVARSKSQEKVQEG